MSKTTKADVIKEVYFATLIDGVFTCFCLRKDEQGESLGAFYLEGEDCKEKFEAVITEKNLKKYEDPEGNIYAINPAIRGITLVNCGEDMTAICLPQELSLIVQVDIEHLKPLRNDHYEGVNIVPFLSPDRMETIGMAMHHAARVDAGPVIHP